MDFLDEEKLMDACMIAGKILMENGAEMHRVEDTMNRILDVKHGDKEAMSFVIPTGIFVTTRYGRTTKMKRIVKRRQNLEMIVEVNSLSRQFSAQELTVDELYDALTELEKNEVDFPYWLKIVSSGLISGFMMLLFEGSFQDNGITMVIGALGYSFYSYLARVMKARFIQEFVATFLMALLANGLNQLGLVTNADTVIIGSIIILVPGIQIMNSIRDFLAGNTISGTVFMMEAMVIAGMIGAGVMSALKIF
ncbi:MAG: threonine/serine exporter family protein [Erysipelothrix sp.]